MKKKHYQEIDSLRGLAAISVSLHHYFFVLPVIRVDTSANNDFFIVNLLKYSPLRFFWAGNEAVILFFVISGYVLSLPFFYSKNQFSYPRFLIKRFFRIYMPYYLAILLAILLKILFYKGHIAGLSEWFNGVWQNQVTPQLVLQHLLLVFKFDYGVLDPILWTLAIEMRISLIFPVIICLVKKTSWLISVFVGLSFSYIFFFWLKQYENVFDFHTLAFFMMFISGALIAKYNALLEKLAERVPRIAKIFLIIVAFFLYTNRYWLLNEEIMHDTSMLSNTLTTAGASLILIGTIANISFFSILKNKLLIFFGKLSYSYYLYHAIILIALIHALYNYLPIYALWIFGLTITLLVSIFSYRYIELPSIELGRKLSKRCNF